MLVFGGVFQDVQMSKRWQEIHRLRVLSTVQEPGGTTNVSDNSEGPPGELCVRRRPSHLIPVHPGLNIIIPDGNINSRGRGGGGLGDRLGPRYPNRGDFGTFGGNGVEGRGKTHVFSLTDHRYTIATARL